jgi:hypothetical protein
LSEKGGGEMKGNKFYEQIFIRCNRGGKIINDVIEVQFVFEVNGFRFFYHDHKISDGRIGACCGRRLNFESMGGFIERVKKTMKKNFPKYIEQVKQAEKLTGA